MENNNKVKILIVDDDPTSLLTMAHSLSNDYKVFLAKNSEDALNITLSKFPDLILLDVHMPDKNGFETAEQINTRMEVHIPIIFVSADKEIESIKQARQKGAMDYLVKPFNSNLLKTKIKNALKKNIHKKHEKLYKEGIELMAQFFIPGTSVPKKEFLFKWIEDLLLTIQTNEYSLTQTIDILQSQYEDASHSVNVAYLCALLGHRLNITYTQLFFLTLAAILHDTGKMRIESDILNKTSTLSFEEFEQVEKHPEFSVAFVKNLNIRESLVLDAIKHHHEKLDGSGYPNGLSGNQIPLFSQIISIADIFDALTTQRSYREKYSTFEALNIMKNEMSQQLNTKFVGSVRNFVSVR